MKITHHFGPINDIQGKPVATYVKETHFTAGEVMPMHVHVHGHQSVLCSGSAIFMVDGVPKFLMGPRVLNVESGHQHTLQAVTDIVWLCLHATDETDPEHIDERLTS